MWRQACVAIALMVGMAMPAEARDHATAAHRPAVRAVFVGINTFKYARAAGIENLDGAVNDAIAMRDALNAAYGYGFDIATPTAPACPTKPGLRRSVMLLDKCATRNAILGAVDAQITAAHAGDTLILYLAGHGAPVDMVTSDYPYQHTLLTGSAFVPYDGHEPGAKRPADIIYLDWFDRVERATARGINVLVIADFCFAGHSLEASPDEVRRIRRFAPKLHHFRYDRPAGARSPRANTAGRQVKPGISVLLTAAGPMEKANEGLVGTDKLRREGGVFTDALINAMAKKHDASVIDLMALVRQTLLDREEGLQNPQIGGEQLASLTATGLSMAAPGVRLMDAALRDGKLVLPSDGALAGMTVGSKVAIYDSASAAIGREQRDPLTIATVAEVKPYSASLRFADPPPANLATWPKPLYARETAHKFEVDPIRLHVDGRRRVFIWKEVNGVPAGKAERQPDGLDVLDAMIAAGQVQEAEPHEMSLRIGSDDTAELDFVDLGSIHDPGFGEKLKGILTQQLRVKELLARARVGDDGPLLCLANLPGPGKARPHANDDDPTACDEQAMARKRQSVEEGKVLFTVVNRAVAPRYITVLAVGLDGSIGVVLPLRGAQESRLEPGRAWQPEARVVRTISTTLCRYIAIASAGPFDAAQWAQPGYRTDYPPEASQCGASPERAMSRVAGGGTDSSSEPEAVWSSTRVDISYDYPSHPEEGAP